PVRLAFFALHSFPTRRSSDLGGIVRSLGLSGAGGLDLDGLLLRLLRGGGLLGLLPGLGLGPHLALALEEHGAEGRDADGHGGLQDRKSTRLNSSHVSISYAVF